MTKNSSGGRANLKVDPAIHREMDIESATRGIKIYELVAEAWRAYKSTPRIEALGESPGNSKNSNSTRVVDSVTLSLSDFASLASQLLAISKQNAAILELLQKVPRRAQGSSHFATEKAKFDRELAGVFKGVGGDKQGRKKATRLKKKMAPQKPGDIHKASGGTQ